MSNPSNFRTLADGSDVPVNLSGWKRQAIDGRDDAYRLKVPNGVLALPKSVDNRKYCSSVEDQGNLGSCTAQMLAGMIEANEIRSGRRLAQLSADPSIGAELPADALPSSLLGLPQVQITNVSVSPSGSISFTATITPDAQAPAPQPGPAPTPAPLSRFVHISRLFGYYATRKLQGTENFDSGATIRNTIKAGATFGVFDEAIYPYVVSKFSENPGATIWENASRYKITSYHAISDGDLSSMKSSLASGYLVGFGFDVYSAFLGPAIAKTGLLCRPSRTESLQGGHAVCLVGYDDAKVMPDGSRGAFLVRNSWGSRWGIQGYFWMAYNYVGDANLCSDFWIVQSSPI